MVIRVINSWDGEPFPHPTCFIAGFTWATVQLFKVIRIELHVYESLIGLKKLMISKLYSVENIFKKIMCT